MIQQSLILPFADSNAGGRQVMPGKTEINSCRKQKPTVGEYKEDLEKSVDQMGYQRL